MGVIYVKWEQFIERSNQNLTGSDLKPYNKKYELNTAEQLRTLEVFLCENIEFFYESNEYHDEFKNPNEYQIFHQYNSTCAPQKWVDLDTLRVNFYFVVGPYADNISGVKNFTNYNPLKSDGIRNTSITEVNITSMYFFNSLKFYAGL